MRVETEVTLTYRNDRGKIIRIDKAWGCDPILQPWTHIGCVPVGARYKEEARTRQPQPIDRHKNYSPRDIAALLDISYDSAIRRMVKMKGCVDLGTKEKRYKRGKRMLRILGSDLLEYLRNHPA
jgi:hypothetical protein